LAFDFLGQFSRDEYNEFKEFLDKEYESLDARVSNIVTEMARVETLINKLDEAENNFLKQYSKIRPITYVDLNNESVTKPYRTKDSTLANATGVSVYETRIQDDIDSAFVINIMKDSIKTQIKYKRDRLEYMIKKAIDTWDQLDNEKLNLLARKDDIKDLKDKIEEIFIDPNQLGVVEIKKQTEKDTTPKDVNQF